MSSRLWTTEELRVLTTIFFSSEFSIGDDAREECRSIADCFGRTPSSIDRQWRNIAAVVKELPHYNIGQLVRRTVADYLRDPRAVKEIALDICRKRRWPLESLIEEGLQPPLETLQKMSGEHPLRDKLRTLLDGMEFKVFSTGSQGFFKTKKLTSSEGKRYQCKVQAVLIGSKHDPTLEVKASKQDISYGMVPILTNLKGKKFRTGSEGYWVQGKINVSGQLYQVSIQAVQLS